MAAIALVPEIGQDFQRMLAHLNTFQFKQPQQPIEEIIRVINILSDSPQIGWPTDAGLRVLVVGQRSHSHIALYRFVSEIDNVFVLAIRSQSESGFAKREIETL